MPRFKIGGSYGYAGTSWEDEIEAETEEEANEVAWEYAIQRVETWAHPADDDDDTEDDCDE